MDVTTERQDGVLTVAVAGRLDGSNSTEFEEAWRSALADDDRAVIVDLEGLSYISSAGLRAVLVIGRHLSTRSVKFAFCSLDGSVREVFEVSNFDRVVPVRESREDALAFVDG